MPICDTDGHNYQIVDGAFVRDATGNMIAVALCTKCGGTISVAVS